MAVSNNNIYIYNTIKRRGCNHTNEIYEIRVNV